MTVCKKCPAWAYSHTATENDQEVRIGFCRFEPPKVFREEAKHPQTGETVMVPISQWPPAREDHWCVRGRVLMEATGQSKPTPLTLGFARQP